MTVTVRPVPKRTYQNGIRPFRPVVPSNNIRPYTLKTWRPPVPEPLPPAPLLGPKELLLLGVAVLAQLWGRINSKKPVTYIPTPGGNVTIAQPVQGTYDPAGNNVVTRGAFRATSFVPETGGTCRTGSVFSYQAQTRTESFPLRNLTISIGGAATCGFINSGFFLGYGTGSGTRAMGGLIALSGGIGWKDFVFDGWTVEPLNPAAPNLRNASELAPWSGTVEVPDREAVPEVLPQVAPTITPLIPTQPQTVPLPEVEPSVVPSTPGPTAPPAVRPATPRPTAPKQIPGATPTRDGALVPQAPATPTATQADAHFPLPGAGPVTGNGPRPTPEGIAQELGRIEQKLERLTNPLYDQPNQPDDRLKWLRDNIGNIIDFFQSINAGGSYTLSSPCVLDANGDRIVYEVEYEGALQSFGVLQNKIDALASLLQVHKDLKQPNCTVKGTGQPVQVNFVQVE